MATMASAIPTPLHVHRQNWGSNSPPVLPVTSLHRSFFLQPYRQLLATISNSPQCSFEHVLWLCAGYSKSVVLTLLFVARLSRVLRYQVCCTSPTYVYAVKNTGHHVTSHDDNWNLASYMHLSMQAGNYCMDI